MTTPTITDYLKYANLQMAAEAFLVTDAGNPKTGTDYANALTTGNTHAPIDRVRVITNVRCSISGVNSMFRRSSCSTCHASRRASRSTDA